MICSETRNKGRNQKNLESKKYRKSHRSTAREQRTKNRGNEKQEQAETGKRQSIYK